MTKVLPGVLNPDEIYARLREPFGYWNSVGLAAAMGLPGLLWLGSRRTGHGALNALAAPGVTLCVATILLAYSRGSLLAAGIGVALWFAIVPLRLRGVAVLALGAAGGAVVAVWTFGQTGLSDDRVALATREAAGYELGVALAVVLLVVLALSLAITFWVAEHPPNKETRREAGAVILILLALAPIALVAALALSDRGLGGSVSNTWRTLTDPSASPPPNDPGRLTAAGSVRARYWNESLKAFRDHLWRGVGAGGYATVRPRYRQDEIDVRHAHGYVMQVAADLGIIGLAASLALLASWLASALSATGLRPRDRGMPFTPERNALVTMLTVVVIFGVHSLIDFTWFVPGNALPALLAAGFLAGRGPLGAGQPLPRPLRWRVHHGLRDPARVTGAVAAIALALVASWAVLGPQRSASAGQDALALLDKGDVERSAPEGAAGPRAQPADGRAVVRDVGDRAAGGQRRRRACGARAGGAAAAGERADLAAPRRAGALRARPPGGRARRDPARPLPRPAGRGDDRHVRQRTPGGGRGGQGGLMQPLAAGEHLDELRDPPGPRLGALGVVDAVQDRVAVRAVELGELGLRARLGVEGPLEVVGDLDAAR